jgi:hypothetical protein
VPESDPPIDLGVGQQAQSQVCSDGPPGVLRFSQTVAQKRTRHSVTEWSLLAQCPRAYEWTYIRPRKNNEERQDLRQDLGTRVHQCLELGRLNELKEIEKEVGTENLDADAVIRWAKNSQAMLPENLAAGRDVWKELAFEVPIQNEVLVGSLDRLVLEERNGVYYYTLLDFKVGKKSKSPRMMVQSYSTQIQLYVLAVQALHSDLGLGDLPDDRFRIQAAVVHISPQAVREVSIPFDSRSAEALARQFVERSFKLIAGASGDARPGGHCQVCQHQKSCPDAVGVELNLDFGF